jgi:hypothetical protein
MSSGTDVGYVEVVLWALSWGELEGKKDGSV